MAAIKTLCLTSLFLIVSRISALQTGSDSKTACESSDVTIGFNFTIGNDSFADRSWYKNSVIPANKIARVVGAAGSLTVESQYIGRIALSGSGGILLYNVTKTDSGSYLFIIVTGTYFEDGTATTTVNVYVNPNASCMPKIEKNSADKFNCTISDACPGKDSIQAIWDDRSVGVFTCPSTTKDTKYKCCAKGDPVTYCNSGGLCTDIECKGSASNSTIKMTSVPCPVQFVVAFIPVLFIGCVIICIAVVIKCKCKVCKDAHHLRLRLGLILGLLLIVSCIIIVILKFTGTITSCEKEVGLGLGLGSGIPFLIIITVNLKFFFCLLFKGTNDEDDSQELDEVTSVQTYVGLEANFSFMLKKDSNKSAVLIKNKSGGIVMIARGKVGTSDNPFYKDRVHFTGNTDEKLISFILRNVALSDAGIYIAVQSDANRTIGGQMLIVKEVSSIQTHVGSEANFNFMLTEDSNKSEVHIKNKSGGVVMIARGKEGSSDDPVYKGRVHFTGNTNQKLISFILRNVTLSDAGIYIADIAVHSDANRIIGCQMLIVKDTKGKTKNPGAGNQVEGSEYADEK